MHFISTIWHTLRRDQDTIPIMPYRCSFRIEFAQDDKNIPNGTSPIHRVNLMVELLLVSQLVVLGWCVGSHYSHEPTSVLNPDVKSPFINRSDLPDTLTQSSRDDHKNSS